MSSSNKSKVLFFCHPEQDYGEFFLFDGLCEIFGDENVVTFPWKKSYYGIADRDYILDDGKRGSTGPCPYQKKRHVEAWSEEKIKDSIDQFNLWVLASPRTYAKGGLRKFMSLRKSNVPIAFCDHDDGSDIRNDVVKEFNPDYIFKRELMRETIGINPLPFSSTCWHFQDDIKEKSTDVFCSFGLTHPIRKNIRNLLQTEERLKKYKVIANVNNCGDKMFSYKNYLEMLASSRINVIARGHGWDSVRRPESLTYSGLVLSDKLPIIIPNDYEDKKNIVYYKSDLSDLVEKILFYLEHDEERKIIGEAGRNHTFKYHTTTRMAEYFLSLINIRCKV